MTRWDFRITPLGMSSFFCRVWPYESLGDLSVNHMMQFFFPLTEASRMVSQHGWPDVPFYLTASTFCDLRGFEIAFSKSRNTASDSTITSLSIIERQLRRSYDAIFPRNAFPVPRVTRWPVLFYLVAVMSRCPFFFLTWSWPLFGADKDCKNHFLLDYGTADSQSAFKWSPYF